MGDATNNTVSRRAEDDPVEDGELRRWMNQAIIRGYVRQLLCLSVSNALEML